MNILCVGNSFAVDASTYIHQIAKHINKDINIYVLYIGGCSLKRHWDNYLSKEKAYEFYENGCKSPLFFCDILKGINFKDYDVVTFQQRSGDSVDAKTFFPELTNLSFEIRKLSNAKFALHKTWSYAKEFSHERYGSNPLNQEKMDEDIKDAYEEVAKISGISHIIPSGEAIKLARKHFGDNLTRDGYHLNERGRTLVGILWVMYLLNLEDINLDDFEPSGYSYDDKTPPVSKEEIKILVKIAKQALINNKGHNFNDWYC